MAKIEIGTGRHSLAHVMAKAVCELYGEVQLAIGPAIDDGFYYDFDLKTAVNAEDLPKIEARMREILKRREPFVRREITREEGEKLFAGDPYKSELLSRVPEGETISVYGLGEDFCDLCRGPHVENAGDLLNWGFHLRAVSGAYWNADQSKDMLQRIYAYAFPDQKELKEHMRLIEEAKKRDHRVLGPQHDLFFFDETAPGMPYWLPKGLKIFNTLLDFWRYEHEKRGYQEISAPLVNDVSLWKTSGHWAHYQDNMFVIPGENKSFAIKPMNCPNAMLVYKRKVRSYRDLPLRFSDCDVLHRKEASGTLHGLLRVQMFRQDDSHNFITEDQIFDEVNSILDIVDRFYHIFGLTYRPMLSTRPADFMGAPELWDRAEAELKAILDTRYGAGSYDVNEGDGAFYGPKIDIVMTDALKRTWQTGTVQLDFQLPRNFELVYTDKDGKQKTPVVVHRVVYGSMERFIGILIEHFACAFPFWFSPEQIRVLTVKEAHIPFAKEVADTLYEAGFKVGADFSEEMIGGKVKAVRLDRVPYALIIGDNECASKKLSVRCRSGKQLQDVAPEDLIRSLTALKSAKALELTEEF
ncbi:MAG: threonine--tRNA ligase [Clostridiales bacterium]|jgi:threonyl-tRNA synthetase|nr:threonine--tRNA ligase [Clostridiales bacterium]